MMQLLSCRYNMDTNRVEARFEDGTTPSTDCITISYYSIKTYWSSLRSKDDMVIFLAYCFMSSSSLYILYGIHLVESKDLSGKPYLETFICSFFPQTLRQLSLCH